MEKVHFTKEKETMLLALYAKALESRSPASILQDKMADEAVKRIDYDFSAIKPTPSALISVTYRAKQLDLWTADFLNQHPDAVVLHLGCGLDSRVYRVSPPAGVSWYDVDYPEIIALRQKLYPQTGGCQTIGTSVTAPGWLEALPGGRPAWVVAEGLTYYLTPGEMKTLLNRISGHFPCGQIAFDAVNRLGAKVSKTDASVRATGAAIGTWWIDDPQDIQQLDPKFKLVTELRGVEAYGFERLSLAFRVMLRFIDLFPNLRRLSRLLRYQF